MIIVQLNAPRRPVAAILLWAACPACPSLSLLLREENAEMETDLPWSLNLNVAEAKTGESFAVNLTRPQKRRHLLSQLKVATLFSGNMSGPAILKVWDQSERDLAQPNMT